MAALTDDVLFGDVWRRPELSPRDRSLVTITVLIATGKPAPLAGHLGRALDNGVQPSETSGLLAHLAIYCGWPSAVSALEASTTGVHRAEDRHQRAAHHGPAPASSGPGRRTSQGGEQGLAAVAPKFVQLTNDVVFEDLWRRSDLTCEIAAWSPSPPSPRWAMTSSSMVYLRRGVESGLTRAQITEALTHLGFYAGWAKATKAMRRSNHP